ncbi:DUF2934 domain-containing protein [Mycoplana dimorpha]|uniref:DUF2934 domain-containing protein n=1 Tax=Mycoplana dimorpha TaxID=28320 RepID=UPI000D352D6C
MIDEREDEIRRRAYSIWESEGRPNDQHERHWKQATEEMGVASGEARRKRSPRKGAGEA